MDINGDVRARRRRLLALTALGIAAPWALNACRPAGQQVQNEKRSLRIGIDLWAGYYPLLLAQELGYLKQAGVEVDISIPQNTHKLLSDFVAGSYDAICASLGDMITLTRETDAIRMVLVADESDGGDVLLSAKPVRSAADVRGRRIGTSLGGFGEMLVLRFLARHGLSLADIELVNVDASEVPQRLREGALDIGHSWEPYVSAGRKLGFQAVFSSHDTPGLIPDGLIFQASVLSAQPSAVRAVVAAWFRAQDWWLANAAEGNAMLLKRLEGKTSEVSLSGVRMLGQVANRQRFEPGSTDASLFHVASQYIEHFVARGVLTRRPALTELLDGQFIG